MLALALAVVSLAAQLHVPLPVAGAVDLDFNFACNPPCAFTEDATSHV